MSTKEGPRSSIRHIMKPVVMRPAGLRAFSGAGIILLRTALKHLEIGGEKSKLIANAFVDYTAHGCPGSAIRVEPDQVTCQVVLVPDDRSQIAKISIGPKAKTEVEGPFGKVTLGVLGRPMIRHDSDPQFSVFPPTLQILSLVDSSVPHHQARVSLGRDLKTGGVKVDTWSIA